MNTHRIGNGRALALPFSFLRPPLVILFSCSGRLHFSAVLAAFPAAAAFIRLSSRRVVG